MHGLAAELSSLGEQLNDKFFAKQIEVFFPEFAAQVADLICYGNTKKRPTSVVDIMGEIEPRSSRDRAEIGVLRV